MANREKVNKSEHLKKFVYPGNYKK